MDLSYLVMSETLFVGVYFAGLCIPAAVFCGTPFAGDNMDCISG